MKKLSVLFAAVIMFASIGLQAQKVATLDVAAVLNAMPEKKKADQQLEAFSTAKAAEIKKQGESAQALYDKYTKEAAAQTADVNKTREGEMQKLSENLEKMRNDAQKEFLQKQDVAYTPIEAKFNTAVSKAAKANGWDFVMDANSPAFVFKGGPDATAAVKKELGQ